MTIVYMARPIDLTGLTEEQNKNYLFVDNALHNRKAVRFQPAQAFKVPREATPNSSIENINRRALFECNALVAFYPERLTVGVPMEIEAARQRGMPILVISDVAHKSWSLAGLTNATVTGFPSAFEVDWLLSRADDYHWTRQGKIGTPMRVQLDDGAQMPTRSYSGDAGFDLYVQEDITIPPGEFADVACGCAVQLPDHLWGLIIGRSSTLRTHKLMVTQGVIDTGYRGPLFAGAYNLADEPFEAKKGMRLAQFIPFGNVAENLRLTESATLDPSARGGLGFGSSGE